MDNYKHNKNNMFEKKYAKIQAQIAELTKQRESIKAVIIDNMLEHNETSKDTTYGKFTVYTTTSYTYTDAVKKLEDEVKVAKVKEEQKGLAIKNETPSLRFTLAKHEE